MLYSPLLCTVSGTCTHVTFPCLSVATSRAGRVGTSVHGSGVVERTDGADRVDGGAPGGNVSEAPTVLALRVPIGGVCSLDRPGTGEETYRGTHDWDVPWVDRDDDGGGSLVLPRPSVGVEKSGGEDAYVFGVEDRLREIREELIRVFREERDGEGVDEGNRGRSPLI